MSKKMGLKEWVDKMGGRFRVASLLEVHESGIRNWLAGRNFPRPEQMAKIRKLSKGAVSFDAIIDHQFGIK